MSASRTTTRNILFAGILAATVGVSVYAAPRVDGSARGDSKSNASRLVTGEAAHMQAVLDGGVSGGSYYIRMDPVDPLDGSAYAGCSIAGQTITCAGPERMWFDLYIGGWGDIGLRTYQIGMAWSVLASGAGAPLVFPIVGCAADADCVTAFGQGSLCQNNLNTECTYAFQDKTRSVNAFEILNLPATDNNDPIRWGSTGIRGGYADPGVDVYAGSMVVDAQAGSYGTYTLDLLTDATTFFVLDGPSVPDLGLFTITTAVVDIPTGQCCRLNDLCTDGVTAIQCYTFADYIVFNAGNACTYNDVCDGANSEADGGCTGSDANSVMCNDDNDCLIETGAALACIDGYCFCQVDATLHFDIQGSDAADPNCFDDGEKVRATVSIGPSLAVIVGAEMTIEYDPSCLTFNEVATIAPFNNILFVDDSVPGEVFVAVGIDLGGVGVGGGNFDLVSLSFTKAGGCTGCDLCFSDVNPRHTRLTNSEGQVVTVIPECSKEVRGNGDLTVDVPDGGKFNVACNGTTREVNWDTPTADDTCAVASFMCGGLYQNPTTGEVVDATTICDNFGNCIDPYSGGVFPPGSATFCCTATNDCGDRDQQCWTVSVNDETSLDVQLQLSPTMTSKPGDGLERCIKFEVFSSCTQAPLVFSENVTFGGLFDLLGKVHTHIKIPSAGQFECITARDQLHTLRSCYTFGDADCDADGVLHATFKGDPFFGGNWLVGGNLDGYKKQSATASLNAIDITDFGMFVSQYPNDYGSGDTPCGTEGPNADINGDGLVDLLDFTFISMNFLEDSKDCCCIGSSAAAPSGRTSISVRSLRANGMGDLAVADLNNDGVVDMDDMQLLLQGEVPTPKGPNGRTLRTGAQR